MTWHARKPAPQKRYRSYPTVVPEDLRMTGGAFSSAWIVGGTTPLSDAYVHSPPASLPSPLSSRWCAACTRPAPQRPSTSFVGKGTNGTEDGPVWFPDQFGFRTILRGSAQETAAGLPPGRASGLLGLAVVVVVVVCGANGCALDWSGRSSPYAQRKFCVRRHIT
jgi:hypothetical protein